MALDSKKASESSRDHIKKDKHASKMIKLAVEISYDETKIKDLDPHDTTLVLNYGFDLLLSHKAIVDMGVQDDKNSKLQKVRDELTLLKSSLSKLQQEKLDQEVVFSARIDELKSREKINYERLLADKLAVRDEEIRLARQNQQEWHDKWLAANQDIYKLEQKHLEELKKRIIEEKEALASKFKAREDEFSARINALEAQREDEKANAQADLAASHRKLEELKQEFKLSLDKKIEDIKAEAQQQINIKLSFKDEELKSYISKLAEVSKDRERYINLLASNDEKHQEELSKFRKAYDVELIETRNKAKSELRDMLNEQKVRHEQTLQFYTSKLSEMSKEREQFINLLKLNDDKQQEALAQYKKSREAELIEENNRVKSELRSQLDVQKSNHEKELSRLEGILIAQINELKTQISELRAREEKYFASKTISPHEKGKIGEQKVQDMLSKICGRDLVFDKSKDKQGMGDLFVPMIFDETELRIAIEIKNQKSIPKEFKNVFRQQVADASRDSERKANCGLFISLEADMGGKRPIQIERFGQLPLIFAHITSDEMMFSAIQMLAHLRKMYNDEKKTAPDECFEALQDLLKTRADNLMKLKLKIKNQYLRLRVERKQLRELEAFADEEEQELKTFYDDFPQYKRDFIVKKQSKKPVPAAAIAVATSSDDKKEEKKAEEKEYTQEEVVEKLITLITKNSFEMCDIWIRYGKKMPSQTRLIALMSKKPKEASVVALYQEFKSLFKLYCKYKNYKYDSRSIKISTEHGDIIIAEWRKRYPDDELTATTEKELRGTK
jgi:hypothetical protein